MLLELQLDVYLSFCITFENKPREVWTNKLHRVRTYCFIGTLMIWLEYFHSRKVKRKKENRMLLESMFKMMADFNQSMNENERERENERKEKSVDETKKKKKNRP